MQDDERPFAVRRELRDGALVVVASGEIDLWSVDSVRSALTHGGDAAAVLLDLREVTFMDSSGLGLVVSEYRRARDEGFPFAIAAGTDSDVRRVLDISGVAQVVEVVDAPEAFLAGGSA
jgi:anti-anti-sigma factor